MNKQQSKSTSTTTKSGSTQAKATAHVGRNTKIQSSPNPQNEVVTTTKQKPRFTREFKDEVTGVIKTFHFDTEKFGMSPYRIDINYPNNWKFEEEIENDESLPISKRKFFNPETGKLVTYTRAHALGLV
jgi:hypothetical protein